MQRLFFLLFLFTQLNTFAQPLPLIDSPWQFRQGDNAGWASEKYDDSNWLQIPIGQSWESALKRPFDGLAWYRRTLVVPLAFQSEAMVNGGLILAIGKIDDADETFFNGVKIGGLGDFPPGNGTAWDVQRRYTIPAERVHWGQANVIAVRVSDTGGGGGLHSGEYGLEPISWKDKVHLTIANADASNAYAEGTPISIRVTLQNDWREALAGQLTCVLRSFTGDSIVQKSRPFSVGPGQSASYSYAFRPLPPGFYIAHVALTGNGGYVLSQRNGFAVAPDKVPYQTTRPPDFDQYWAKTKAELARVAPDFQVKLDSQRSTANVDVYLVEMKSLGGVGVRGWYTRPRGKAHLPAMLHVQGYSTIMEPSDLGNLDFAQFFLNIRGHGNSRDDVRPGFPGYLQTGIENKETYIYRGAYMDCLRAVDFLCSRSEVDTARIGVMGGSQGGALSVATAALDPRIKLCLPDVPFLSDFRLYFQVARWPANEFKDYMAQPGHTWEQVYSVLDYIDIMNLAPMVNCPVLMGVGLFDEVCPAAINFAMYNSLKTKVKQYYLYASSGHGLPSAQYTYQREWMDAFLGRP